MGEPGGVGPELTIKAWRSLRAAGPTFYVLAPIALFATHDCPIAEIATPHEAHAAFADALPVLPFSGSAKAEAATLGKAQAATASAVIGSIERAVDDVFTGAAAAIVTNPIHKAALQEANFQHPGHTEFLGSLCEQRTGEPTTPIMMLAGPTLRTVPATIHLPVKEAAASLKAPALTALLETVRRSLTRDFGVQAPRIAVSGLNPHAGENGKIGREDLDVIAPAIAAARSAGVNAIGPLSADAMFHDAARAAYDAAVCMLHDQALIPIKMLHFYDAVNLTLGLPIVRASPDHGTALDIAGQGIARADSLIAAIKTARAIADRRAAANADD